MPSAGQSCYESTMNTTALPWSVINDCASTESDAVQTQAMKATPSHDCKMLAILFVHKYLRTSLHTRYEVQTVSSRFADY